ncbi:MAG TPA: spherulation-specific family 4 protein, partial [Capsulimonadaceae bacterium]|nr:spherulation-specific family 4 protein [Capsulimonadaceae bacterium]
MKMAWAVILIFLTVLSLGPTRAVAQKQRMADPSYFYPGPLWTKLEAAVPTVGLAIINPASGPGDRLDPNYVTQVKEAKAHGLIVLGYVHTSYAKRNLRDVEAEADHYFQWYHVSGIFYDEVSNDQPGLSYYKEVFAFTKKRNPQAMVVLNPGTQVIAGYMKAADIICTFESPYNSYQKEYNAPSWVTTYPASRFWHIVLSVPAADMKNVVS